MREAALMFATLCHSCSFNFQHLRIYGGAMLTCTRGLWTPVKCYFVRSFKWLDRKPSNRGINSQYWPVFLLRPALMASVQVSKERPLAQNLCLDGESKLSQAVFFFFLHSSRNAGYLTWSLIGSGPLDTCPDHSITFSQFLECFVWTEDHMRLDIFEHSMWSFHVFVHDKMVDTLSYRHIYADWDEYGYWQAILANLLCFLMLTMNRRINSTRFSEDFISWTSVLAIIIIFNFKLK